MFVLAKSAVQCASCNACFFDADFCSDGHAYVQMKVLELWCVAVTTSIALIAHVAPVSYPVWLVNPAGDTAL